MLRHVYMAVRDRDWNTIPPRITNQRVRALPDGYEISFDADHHLNEIHFAWRGTIRGTGDRIEFEMDGIARSSFWKNRIGFCVLHPTRECIGRTCTVRHTDGSITTRAFPVHVNPHQLFLSVRSLSHEPVPGILATVTLEGDTFETEDHRNWTDDSFKTYSTPLSLPFPAFIEAGQRIRQRVLLAISGDVPTPAEPQGPATVEIFADSATALPRIGLGSAYEGGRLNAAAIEQLRRLRLNHLRVDVHPSSAGWEQSLLDAAANGQEIGATLELAIHLSEDRKRELENVIAAVAGTNVSSWIVYDKGNPATSVESVKIAKSVCGTQIGGGSAANFAELNRNRAVASAADFLAFSINPQVHGTDECTIVETLAGQAAAVQSALAFDAGLPVAVSPVTLKPRFNAVATSESETVPPVDPRQSQPFTAAWTLGSLASLAHAGASSITYFETVGPRGIMNPSGTAYPVFRVFRAIAGFEPDGVVPCRSSKPLEAAALVITRGGLRRIITANLTREPTEIVVEPFGLCVPVEPYGVTWIDK
jgi:hypothetical protein